MSQFSGATSVFLDRYGPIAGRSELSRLGEISSRFANLPWENLTKFLVKHAADSGKPRSGRSGAGRKAAPRRLRRGDEVLADHARFGSGGTCFSLTDALRRIVTDLGFHAAPVMADMHHGSNAHCALRVELQQGAFLLDPGYLVVEPVPLARARVVSVAAAGQRLEYRRAADGSRVELATRNDRGEERLRYRLRPLPVAEREFLAHWRASFDSTGMNGLHLNRLADGCRLSAHDLNLRIDDGRDKRNLKLRRRYVETISERFGIDAGLVRRAFAEWERQRCRRG